MSCESSLSQRAAKFAGTEVHGALLSCSLLNDPYIPTPWCNTTALQFALLQSRVAAASLREAPFDDEWLPTDDGELLRVRWLHAPAPRAVVVILHGVTGCALDVLSTAKAARSSGYAVAVFERRGHSAPLRTPQFNTTGSLPDMELALSSVAARYPAAPVLAVGVSAGASLLLRYLGTHGASSVIRAAVCVSMGYGFKRSMRQMHPKVAALSLWRMKQFFLERNAGVLDPDHAAQLASATTLEEWHRHQWRPAGAPSRKAYHEEHNTNRLLSGVAVPTLFLNALDDTVFTSENVHPLRRAATASRWIAVVQTSSGGHGTFFEGAAADSWADKLVMQWFEAVRRMSRIAV